MEDLRHNKIDDLDRRCSTDTTILLKALSLFLPSDRQPELLLLVKIMEIQQIMQWMRAPGKRCEPVKVDDYEQVFATVRPFLTEPTAQKIEQMINIASMIRMYQQMKDLMEVLGPLSADNIFQSCSSTADSGIPNCSATTDGGFQSCSSTTDADVQNGSDTPDGDFQSSFDAADGSSRADSGPADGGVQNSSRTRSGGRNEEMLEMLKSMIPPENQAMVEMLMHGYHQS